MVSNLRQSQALFPFGVGAIINVDGQSFVACDITRWHRYEKISDERLQRHLGVKEFRSPPIKRKKTDQSGVPFFRFPRWLFCGNPECRRMHFFTSREEAGKRPTCRWCDHPLTPMRFVMACENGHLRDLPWEYWAHSSASETRCEDRRQLRFRTNPKVADGSLASLIIECISCKSTRDLGRISSLTIPCDGRHPWLRTGEGSTCDKKSIVLQRGASNLRYDLSVEAIDIPPYSDFDYWGDEAQRVRTHSLFNELTRRYNPGNPWFDINAEKIAEDLQLALETVERVLAQEQDGPDAPTPQPDASIDFAEYLALTSPDREHEPRDRFQKRQADLDVFLDSLSRDDPGRELYCTLRKVLKRVVLVNRLRCVRVLRGYSRISRNPAAMVPVDIGKGDGSWLPAIEVFGEGVFIEIDGDALGKWRDQIGDKADGLVSRFLALPEGLRRSYSTIRPVSPDPQFVLLHTLSHLLMLQMQFKSGYSASSVRERLYFGERDDGEGVMSGILIFTSAGDVEGSMGGLVRLGEPENLFPMLLDAVRASTMCSSDPVCSESAFQGLDGLNVAACHACALIPETACAFRNQLLDRGLISGSPKRGIPGFMAALIEQLEN